MKPDGISIRRIRVGIVVWVVSWLPFPLLLLAIGQANGKYTTSKESSQFLLVAYCIQYAIGFVGLFVAGSAAVKLVKDGGWRPMPRKVWNVVIHGKLPDSVPNETSKS